ncbi:phage portal protein [Lactiplantibacillus pentosus]|uniref:phage portal protein n=1 Tax=Lactiplantibacillus pentosus TaxID=1589 RepID=UPI001CDC531C|nr:phage portal protein [Lactiplantibacillus pentosus]
MTNIAGNPISYTPARSAFNNTDVYAVVVRIASDIASAKLSTENTAVLDLLERPNPLIGHFSFWQGVIIQLLLAGNAYVPLNGNQWEHVPPSDVQINYNSGNQGITYTVMANNDRPEMILPQSQMLHFRLSPDARYRYLVGRSPLESLKGALDISEKTYHSNGKALDSQIAPSGTLKLSNFIGNATDLKAAREEFENANAGSNAGRVMVLADGMEYSPYEMKTDVFSVLTENSNFSADQISKAFGVPSDVLGGGTSTESSHSNISQVNSVYLSNLNSYIYPLVEELKLKLAVPDLTIDTKTIQDANDTVLVNQVNALVTSGAIDQGQAEFYLKSKGYLPMNLPEFKAPATGTTSTSKGGEKE